MICGKLSFLRPTSFLTEVGEGFVDIARKCLFFFAFNCHFLFATFSFMFNIDCVLVSIARNSGICTKFTTPRIKPEAGGSAERHFRECR
jgi:hypothetical protein